jgi:membrane-associated phospholipid phosphatase
MRAKARERIANYLHSPGIAWARLVSDILSPPVIWGALALPIAFRDAETSEQALLWAFTYITLVCLLPLVYIALMVRRGTITDIHMQVREQRIRPFVVSLIFTTIAWWTLRFMGAPSVVPLLALFSLIQLALMTLITLVWQISMHMMSISGAMVALGFLFGTTAAIVVLPFVILVGAARLKLKRHTPAQVVAGAALGVLIPMVLLTFAL